MARLAQHQPLQQLARGRKGQQGALNAGAARQRLGAFFAPGAGAGEHAFAVIKVATPGVAEQGVAAVHVFGVDRRHHKRPGPGLGQIVKGCAFALGLARTLKARRQGKGVEHGVATAAVFAHVGHGSQGAGQGAARGAALHHPHPAVHRGNGLAAQAQCLLLQIPDAQVKRNRIKAARKHNARAAGLGRGLQERNHLGHPDRLAAQVHIVGAHFGAGHNQRLAVQLVGPNGGNHHLGLRHQGAQGGWVLGVGLHQRQVWAGQLSAHALELGHVAPGQRPARGLALGQTGQILGDQMAGKAGGAENDDVVGFLHG